MYWAWIQEFRIKVAIIENWSKVALVGIWIKDFARNRPLPHYIRGDIDWSILHAGCGIRVYIFIPRRLLIRVEGKFLRVKNK